MPIASQPEDQKYKIQCKVVVVTRAWEEEADGGQQHEAKMVLLVPRHDTTQGQMFLAAWLPDTVKDHNEIAMVIGHPIFSPCRGAVMRSGENHPEHHIFVMSTGVEESLRIMNGKEVVVTVLPQNMDEEADNAPTIERDVR